MFQKKSRKCVPIISKIATGLVIISIVWGLLLASLGFMNLLPLKVNWPVGYTSEALQIGNNYTVPVEFVSRVQLYDSECKSD